MCTNTTEEEKAARSFSSRNPEGSKYKTYPGDLTRRNEAKLSSSR